MSVTTHVRIVCGSAADKGRNCYGARLSIPFRGVRVEDDWELVWGQGWVELPELSHAQGQVIDFAAALIAYLRDDLELADKYFSSVIQSDAEGLVREDAIMLRGVCRARSSGSIDGFEGRPGERSSIRSMRCKR